MVESMPQKDESIWDEHSEDFLPHCEIRLADGNKEILLEELIETTIEATPHLWLSRFH